MQLLNGTTRIHSAHTAAFGLHGTLGESNLSHEDCSTRLVNAKNDIKRTREANTQRQIEHRQHLS